VPLNYRKAANRTKERILLSSETAGAMPLEASSIVAVIVRCMLHLETHAKKAYGMEAASKSEDVHTPICMRKPWPGPKSPALSLGGGNCVRAESGVAEHLVGQSACAWHAATAPVISRACAAGTLGARGHACDWGRVPMIRADLAATTNLASLPSTTFTLWSLLRHPANPTDRVRRPTDQPGLPRN